MKRNGKKKRICSQNDLLCPPKLFFDVFSIEKLIIIVYNNTGYYHAKS